MASFKIQILQTHSAQNLSGNRMLLTVKDACEFHPMALDYAMSEQIENLSDVIERTERRLAILRQEPRHEGDGAPPEPRPAAPCRQSDQAVFELKQAMGGGKTHSMIARASWPGARAQEVGRP